MSERSRDDRLALIAVVAGATVAFVTRRDPMGLGTGLALGLAGAMLALRGDRPIGARSWLRAALAITVLAVGVGAGIDRYQEWIVAQWFAEGATSVAANGELSRLAETAAGLRIAGLASSLAMLLGALVNRMK